MVDVPESVQRGNTVIVVVVLLIAAWTLLAGLTLAWTSSMRFRQVSLKELFGMIATWSVIVWSALHLLPTISN